jgi:drug/metabolite transporter (DMT)-like permease
MESDRLKIGSGYILISLIWGSTWLAIRVGLDYLTPIISAGIRFLLASFLIYGLMKIRKISLQTDSNSMKLYFVLGIFSFAIPFGLVYWAEQFIPSGLASILFAVFPFFVIIFSKIALPNHKIFVGQIIGVSIGFVGIVVIFSRNLSINFTNDFVGMLAVFLSATMQAGIAVVVKKYGGHINSLSLNFLPLLISGVLMIPLAFILEDSRKWNFTTSAIGSILYLAFFGTLVTFTIYYWLMKKINIVILSITSLITPIIAVILGWIFLNEKLSLQDIIGSSLVLIGILFANFRGLINYYESTKKKFSQ